MRCDTSSGQERRLNSALYVPCSLRVSWFIGRHTVGAILVPIFVVVSVTGGVLFTHPVGDSELR